MREILFRGKRIDNGEWVYGNLNYGTIEIKSIKDSYYISDFDVNPWDKKFYPVIPESVGQFTGLTDKNGTRVFEGDIIVVSTSEKGKTKKYRVEFDNGIFGIRLSTNANDNTIIPLRSFDYIETRHYKDYKPPTIIEAEVSE